MQTQKKNSSIKYITMNFQKTSQKNNSKEDQNFDNSNDLILRKTPKQSIQSYIYIDRKLRVKQFQRIKKNRARLMDWYLQVYCIFQLSWSSYWYAIELIDTLIADFDYIRVENVHIVGIVCCFLSAKMMERNTLTLQDLYDRIGHHKFRGKNSKSDFLQFQLTHNHCLQLSHRKMHKYSKYFPQKGIGDARFGVHETGKIFLIFEGKDLQIGCTLYYDPDYVGKEYSCAGGDSQRDQNCFWGIIKCIFVCETDEIVNYNDLYIQPLFLYIMDRMFADLGQYLIKVYSCNKGLQGVSRLFESTFILFNCYRCTCMGLFNKNLSQMCQP